MNPSDLIRIARKSDDPDWHIRRRLQRVWCQMVSRCTKPSERNYHRYGARGIRINPRWYDFESFHGWAVENGYRPGLSIERVNNDGDYSPENCKWIPLKDQQLNTMRSRFIEFNGKRQTTTEWAREVRISADVLEQRINALNWPVEKALTTPLRSWRPRRTRGA